MNRKHYVRSGQAGIRRPGYVGGTVSIAAQSVERDREAARNRSAAGGLQWKRIDLHLHTPASSDYRDVGISYLDILKKAEEKGLDMIAFADHNSVGGYAAMYQEIETLTLLERLNRLTDDERRTLNEYGRLLDTIVVLPAFEFTATFGFHILGVFPENTSVRKLEHLLLDLNVPEEKMLTGAPDVGSTSDVLRAYSAITAAGGLAIAAHANSSNGVAMQGFPFGGQTKIAYTQDVNLAALEVTDLEGGRRSIAYFYNGSKPEYPRRMHLIQGSDAHSLETEQADSANKRLGVGARITEILVREASFASLKEILLGDDFTRTRPYRPNTAWDLVEFSRKQGPNIVQSFHERAFSRTDRNERTRPILRDVVAFANVDGGTIYIGVNPDTRMPIVGVDRPEEDVRFLSEDIRAMIEPAIEVEFEIRPGADRAIVVMHVPKGKEKPYVFTPMGQIYVRVGAATLVGGRNEIVRLVLESAGVEGATLPEPAARPEQSRPLASAGEPMSPAQLPARQSRWDERGQADRRPSRDVAPQLEERFQPQLDIEPAFQPEPEVYDEPVRDRERLAEPAPQPAQSRRTAPPAHLLNLPPEKIKGKVQPMFQPSEDTAGSAGMPDRDSAPAEAEMATNYLDTTEAAFESTLTDMPSLASEVATGGGEQEPEDGTVVSRGRARSRRRNVAADPAAEIPAESLSEEPAGIEAVSPMEATVSAEHKTREELVAEEAPKPRRGRGRKAQTASEELLVGAPTAAAAATEAGTEAILVGAEVEPGAQIPAEIVAAEPEPIPAKSRARRKKGATAEVVPEEQPAPEPIEEPAAQEEAVPAKRVSRGRGRKKEAATAAPVMEPPDPPTTGVEVTSTETRNGMQYHTMRDMRNGTAVHNVTKKSARRLWHYAIVQHERGAPELAEVLWHPDQPVGLWRRDNRAGAERIDLVSRMPDGTMRLFYGVTEDGLHGPWLELIAQADAAGYVGPEAPE